MSYDKEDYEGALARIGRSQDGLILRHMLLVEVQRTISDSASDGALRVLGARRNFASQLLRQLDPKSESDGRTADASLADTARSAISGAGSGARRRVPDTAE